MISGIHHLGLTVRDVDASAAWYQEVLGFGETSATPHGAETSWCVSSRPPVSGPCHQTAWAAAVTP